jgi:hypothetical protein
MGGMDLQIRIFSTLHQLQVVGQPPGRLASTEIAPSKHCLFGWVSPRASMEDARKRKFSTLPVLEHQRLGRSARSE